ncbi:MAG: hypothetical protein IPM61_05550 [Chlorobi bacterium]|nr:MAG: hypothetical protein UZ07_CHB004000898 [Chlorobi bacterium OLB7]MBK8910778.1 hypothetical protein [Chlorobiota bacterium]MBX7216045.1 hypothetical protein [Candidatus Kapabacteria bacterium]
MRHQLRSCLLILIALVGAAAPLRLGLPALMTLQANGTPRNARELSAMAAGESYNPTAVRALLQEWRK